MTIILQFGQVLPEWYAKRAANSYDVYKNNYYSYMFSQK